MDASSGKRWVADLQASKGALSHARFHGAHLSLYHYLFKHARDIILVMNPRGILVEANRSAVEAYGYDRYVLLGSPFTLLEHEQAEAGSTSHASNYETVHRRKDGSCFPVEVSTQGMTLGGKDFLVSIIRDTSDRQIVQQALQRSNAFLVAQQEASLEGILIYDLAFQVVSLNHRFVTMFDLSPELTSCGDARLLREFILGNLQDPEALAWTSSEANPYGAQTSELHLKDGRIFECYTAPALSPDGALYGRVNFHRDVTELRRNQIRLAQAEQLGGLGYWDYDIASNELIWSAGMFHLYGLDPDTHVPSLEDVLQRTHPEDRHLMERGVTDSRQAGIPFAIDTRIVRDDGQVRMIRRRSTLIKNESGQLIRVTGSSEDVTERLATEAEIRKLAYMDSLTGLPNRHLFGDRLSQALAIAKRHERAMAVLFLDLDHFKVINDSLGHDVGDLLLKGIGERLVACVRESDTVARLGGDEFTILLAEITGERDATRIGDRILEAMSQPLMVGDREIYITTSIGISLYPHDGGDAATLLKHADAAMYRAKEHRNRYQRFVQVMNDSLAERFTLEASLHKALANHELSLHYQPLISADGSILGVEALARWQHPELGPIAPIKFIPLAEETGLIIPLTEWVLRTACEQHMAWQAAGLGSIHISVNLSGQYLKRRNLLTLVTRVLHDTGMDARHLGLELTESILMENLDTTLSVLRTLQGLGIKVAIDDFGTGYSSLSYLRRFPIDVLKIDRAFVQDISANSDDVPILKAMIALAHSLQMLAVAEGVETREQAQFLIQNGCDGIQGYYYSKPLLPQDFATFRGEHALHRLAIVSPNTTER